MSLAAVTDNRSLLQKADMALSDLSSGGLLLPAQAQQFMRIAVKESKLMALTTVKPMKSQNEQVDKIRFAGRILRAGLEGQALALGDRSKPTTSKVELAAKLFKGEVHINNEVLEDNIERQELKNTVMQLMAVAVARDLEEVVITGDTTSDDSFLAQFNGILKQSVSHVVDAAVVKTNRGMFRDMLKAMPQEYRRDKSTLRFFTSGNSELDYRDVLADRQTPLGDTHAEDAPTITYSGIPIIDIPLMPENLGSGTNCTNMLLLDPKNINVGIWRNIRVETDKNVSEGTIVIVVSLRADVKYAHEDAVVKATNVKVS